MAYPLGPIEPLRPGRDPEMPGAAGSVVVVVVADSVEVVAASIWGIGVGAGEGNVYGREVRRMSSKNGLLRTDMAGFGVG